MHNVNPLAKSNLCRMDRSPVLDLVENQHHSYTFRTCSYKYCPAWHTNNVKGKIAYLRLHKTQDGRPDPARLTSGRVICRTAAPVGWASDLQVRDMTRLASRWLYLFLSLVNCVCAIWGFSCCCSIVIDLRSTTNLDSFLLYKAYCPS